MASSQPPEKSPDSVTWSGLRNQSPQLEAVKGLGTGSKSMKGNLKGQGMIHVGDQREVCDLVLPVLSPPAVGLGAPAGTRAGS